MSDQIIAALATLKYSRFRSQIKLTDKGPLVHPLQGIRSHTLDFITTRLAHAFPKKDGKLATMKGHFRIHCPNMRLPPAVVGVCGNVIRLLKGER